MTRARLWTYSGQKDGHGRAITRMSQNIKENLEVAAKGGRRATRNKAVSIEQILDTAEELFSCHSYDEVSTRMISSRAGFSLGLLTYHFATKDILLDAVLARRAALLDEARRASFARLPPEPGLEQVFDAFARPVLDLMTNGDAGWRAYGRLLARMHQDPRWAALLLKHFGAVGRVAIERIMAAEPSLSPETAQRGFTYALSVLMGTFEIDGLLDLVSEGRMSGEDISAAYPSLLSYIVGGFRALAGYRMVRPQALSSAKG
ncbi:TetR family transcriptional regulator [Sphingomonas paucimobilis]|nr:TetR family transcriptional regulator [Sphingomonas paucimobilis]